ncbi:MAG: Gfo/Idh/MocA family oxidoreductase [bacterium]|nr:Gfo/Idh/MocA family oxidoreductase [bacterium]
MDHLRIGLAGLGHGQTLLGANRPENADLPLRVTALCDANPQKLDAIGVEYEIQNTTTDFSELVSRKDLDIIGIYTPGPLHADQILAALDAGKHVMVTKSMVYTMEEAERVVEAVDRTGLVLLVTQTMRGRYDFMAAKHACDAGEIGDLFMAEAHYVHDLRPVYDSSPWRIHMPQDLILGGACHPIDLLRWFMGDIEEVHCYGLHGGVSKDYPQEDNFVINVRFKSAKIGRVANFLGVIHPHGVPMNSLTVYGTRGTIVDGKKRVDRDGLLPARTQMTEFPDARGHYSEMIVMLHHMADCVLKGETPWVGVREGARIVSTGLACWESLRTGKPITVRNEF